VIFKGIDYLPDPAVITYPRKYAEMICISKQGHLQSTKFPTDGLSSNVMIGIKKAPRFFQGRKEGLFFRLWSRCLYN
jgi:hypothetical protein